MIKMAFVLAALLFAGVGIPAFASGGSGYMTVEDPRAFASLALDTSHAGRALDFTKFNLVYTDTFATGSGLTGVACDVGTETNQTGTGNHNWFATVILQGGSNVHEVGPATNPNIVSCPVSGYNQGITLHQYWNSSASQWQGANIAQSSRAGYGVQYKYALWKSRIRFAVPGSTFYPWVGHWVIADNAVMGVPAKNWVSRSEFDGLETYPGNTSILTYTFVGGSGGTNGTYTNVKFNGTHGNNNPLFSFSYDPAYFNVTVSGGAITTMTLVNGGQTFKPADVLTLNSGQIPGLTGASVTVSTVGRPATAQGIIDTTYIQHVPSQSAVCNGHISAAGSGGTDGTYTKLFTGGHGFSFNADIIISGGAVTSVKPASTGFTGFSYQVGDSLTYTGLGLTGFTYIVDGICSNGDPTYPNADRQISTFHTPHPEIAQFPFDGQWHNWEIQVTPNFFIAYVDEVEYARIPIIADAARQIQTLQIQNASLDATPLGTGGLNTSGDYHVDVYQVDVYQCKVGDDC